MNSLGNNEVIDVYGAQATNRYGICFHTKIDIWKGIWIFLSARTDSKDMDLYIKGFKKNSSIAINSENREIIVSHIESFLDNPLAFSRIKEIMTEANIDLYDLIPELSRFLVFLKSCKIVMIEPMGEPDEKEKHN